MKFKTTFKIEINDVRADLTVSEIAILRLFETAACNHSDIAGYGIKNLPETHYSWFILAWKVEVLDRPIYGDTVTVVTWPRDSERFYTFRDFEMYDSDGKLLVRAATKWALIHIEQGLKSIPLEIIDRYGGQESDCVFPERTIEKLVQAGGEETFRYKIGRRDIDLNHHVHNLNYLEFALAALPDGVYGKAFSSVEIMYKSAAVLGDTIVCYYNFDGARHTVTIKNAETGALSAVIRLS